MKMGIQKLFSWIPACAGMTSRLARHLQWQDGGGQRLCRVTVIRELFYAMPLALMFLLALTPGISLTEDLGRHLLLGKIIVATGQVPDTNLLTYTYPDFSFINHHWLSEVIFYLVHQVVGLNGLILLKAFLVCAALALALRSVPILRISPLTGFAAMLAAATLGYRAHIRPELFTYLGVAFYGWLIVRAENSPAKKMSGKSWAVLIAYGWFWANAHIYFIFGIGMIFFYWLACWRQTIRQVRNEMAEGRNGARAWPRTETFGLLALISVSLLNPNGWRGLMYPLGIFGNYGINITENASPLSLWETVLNPMLIALPFLSLCALLVFWRTFLVGRDSLSRCVFGRTRLCGPTFLTAGQLAGVLILLAALIASWSMARSTPLLALTLLPALNFCVRDGMSKLGGRAAIKKSWIPDQVGNDTRTHCVIPAKAGIQNMFRYVIAKLKFLCPWSNWLHGVGIIFVIALNLGLALAVIEGSYSRLFPSPIGPTPFGFDDESRYLALKHLSADGLPMPIFSDYNSGSLVEYNIYPERGYVDNRPEAFPEEFWQDEYLPALALGTVWEEMIVRRNIQTVAVSTAGVKEHFIRLLLANPRWQLVHLDFFFAVFVRNTSENRDFLQRHAFGQKQAAQYARQTAQQIRILSRQSLWRKHVLADQIVYELYGLICLGRNDLAWLLVWEMYLRYPDYQVIHELMRVSAPPYAWPAIMEILARRARWPLAAKQVLDYGAALEAQGRNDEARAVYQRGKIFFPLCPTLRKRCHPGLFPQEIR